MVNKNIKIMVEKHLLFLYMYVYLKVTIICRYIFLRFWNSVHFTGIKFCAS